MRSVLRLVQRERPRRALEGGASESARSFLDFEMDEKSMYDELQRRGFDHIGALWLDPIVEQESRCTVARLLGQSPPDVPPDRVAVFVCPECGDLGCGAVTVRLSLDADTVTWSDWAWLTDYDPEPDLAALEAMPVLTFDRASYEGALQAVLRT